MGPALNEPGRDRRAGQTATLLRLLVPSPWLLALVCLWWAWRLLAAQAVVAGALGGRWDLDAIGLGLLVDLHVLAGLGLLRRAALLGGDAAALGPAPYARRLDAGLLALLGASLCARALVGFGAAIQGAWPNARYWQLVRGEPASVAAELVTVAVLVVVTALGARACLRRDISLLARHVAPTPRQRVVVAAAGLAAVAIGAALVPALAARLTRPAHVDLSQSAETLTLRGLAASGG